MQGKIKPAKVAVDRCKWHPWFAWFPVRASISPDLTPKGVYPPWRWVWLDYVERKLVRHADVHYYQHKVRRNE